MARILCILQKLAATPGAWGALALLAILGALTAGDARADGRRVALVIGNADYKATVALRNTLNDADLISGALREVGFEVVDGRNLDKAGADRALARFASLVQGADAAMFYFAGHGLQISGQNYLLPVDARGDDELSLPFESIKLSDVLALLSQSGGVRIVALDACRNNPFSALFARKNPTRGAALSRGLARTEKTQGMLVAYATQANEVAEDGKGANSPFSQELARAISEPGARVGDVFQNVVRRVHEGTAGRQTPEVSFSLIGEFYFNRAETDLDAWKKAAASKDAAQLRAFTARFPSSPWVETARVLIEAYENTSARRHPAATVESGKAQIEQDRIRPDKAPAGRVATSGSGEAAPERSCSELLMRIQLGEMTAADVEAVKKCK